MTYQLVMRSDGMHGYVIPHNLVIEFGKSSPRVSDVTAILDILAGDLHRKVANVRYTTVSLQGAEHFDKPEAYDSAVIHATISICYDGQSTPSTEIHFEFFHAIPYLLYKGQRDFSHLATYLTKVEGTI